MLPDTFCIAPFLQHTTHPSGSFSPCPYLGGTVFFRRHETLKDQWLDPELNNLRSSFLNAEKNPICSRCWNEETYGKRSLRKRLYDLTTQTSDYAFAREPGFAQSLETAIREKTYLNGPRILTIKNGNVCNARCRTCYPECSSRWINDAKKINAITGQYWYNETNVEQNWSDQQIDDIVATSHTLTRLELFGGEPLFNKQVKKLLGLIIAGGSAKNITLYCNTNGTVNFLDTMPEVTEFKNLEVGVSIDGVDEQFNYIRNGADYAQVVNNVKLWKQTLSPEQFWIDCITTVNILNVFYLPEIKSRMCEIFGMSPFWNLLIEPRYLSIANMPDRIKYSVTDRLGQDAEFADLVLAMNQPTNLDEWSKFLKFTQVLDQIRNESFAKTFPEFYNLILTE